MSDIILNPIVGSDNPMKAGCECYFCLICKDTDLENKALMAQYFSPGNIVANSPDKELPVYPNLDNIIRDTIEATFNPDIDKTMHFDLGDVDDLHIFKAKLLVDANSTSTGLVFTVNACQILEKLDMVPIRTEMRLKAIKYGKTIDPDAMSASEKQKYDQSGITDLVRSIKAGENPDFSKYLTDEDIQNHPELQNTDSPH